MYDLVIIGAGPAGLTSGLYAARYKLNTIILEKMVPGGQIMLSERIENFPGFPGGIYTYELIERIKKQLDELGVVIETEEALDIIPSDNIQEPVYSVVGKYKSYQTKTIIISTGGTWKKLGVKGEERFLARGVSYCGTCDGPLFKEKDVVVVGGGNSAIEEAIFLSRYASKVMVVHRRQQLRASEILQEQALRNPKISFILDSVIEEITGENKVEGVKIKNVKTNQLSDLSCQGVFIFVGIEPNTGFVKKVLNTDEGGFIITAQDLSTSRPGIYACGDCIKKSLYQVINACGEGAVASDSAHKYILNKK